MSSSGIVHTLNDKVFSTHSWKTKLMIALVALVVAQYTSPFTAQNVFNHRDYSRGWNVATIYGIFHDRPFHTVDGLYDEYYKIEEKAQNLIGKYSTQKWYQAGKTFQFINEYNNLVRNEFYGSSLDAEWKPRWDAAGFQQGIAYDMPLLVFVSKLSMSEIHIGAIVVILGWIGLMCFYLVLIHIWPNWLIIPFSFIITSLAYSHSWAGIGKKELFSGISIYWQGQDFLVPCVTIYLLYLLISEKKEKQSQRNYLYWSMFLVLLFSFHRFFYFFFSPLPARLFIWIGLLFVAGVGIFRRNKIIIFRVIASALIIMTIDHVFGNLSKALFFPVTNFNHATSESYAVNMIAMGLGERPNILGYLFMDEIFPVMTDIDPILIPFSLQPHWYIVQHSFNTYGLAFLKLILTTNPFVFVEAMLRRIYFLIFYNNFYLDWELNFDYVFISQILLIIFVSLLLLKNKEKFILVMPVTLCVLWNMLGLNTLTTVVHGHSHWILKGSLLVYIFTPIFIIFVPLLVLRYSRTLLSGLKFLFFIISNSIKRVKIYLVSSHMRISPHFVVVILLCMLFAFSSYYCFLYVSRTMKKENIVTTIWGDMHKTFKMEYSDIDSVLERIEKMRALGFHRKGALDMWTASIIVFFEARWGNVLGPIGSPRRKHLQALKSAYFGRGISGDPDNMHYPYLAYRYKITDWEKIAIKAIKADPDYPFAPITAFRLAKEGRGLTSQQRQEYYRFYEDRSGQFLEKTADKRPGYVKIPEIDMNHGGVSSSDNNIMIISLNSGEEAYFERHPLYHGDTASVISYLDVKEGQLDAGIYFEKIEGTTKTILEPSMSIKSELRDMDVRYRNVYSDVPGEFESYGLYVRAGSRGAVFETRDYYPLVYGQKKYLTESGWFRNFTPTD
ncbi:hypothetical protein ACFL47_01120 [Candidatus Latescibacterota bacterium]